MTSPIGVHIEANSAGYSRDRAIESIRRMNASQVVVVNDPQLCMMCLDIGVTPIYRINRQGFLDDNAHQHFNASDYIRQANMEVPDPRVKLYLNNEPGQADLDRLNNFMIEGANTAHSLNRKLVGFNWAYRNLTADHWRQLKPSVDVFNSYNFEIGFHEGYDLQFNNIKIAKGEAIGRFIPAMLQYGFKPVITEFAASKDAWNGWSSWLSEEQWALLVEDAIREVYFSYNIAIMPFTLFQWHNGFSYVDAGTLQDKFAKINSQYKENTTMNPTTSGVLAQLKCPGPDVNVRQAPGGFILGTLLKDDVVTVYLNAALNGSVYITQDDPHKVSGWVSLQNGTVQFTPIQTIFTSSEQAILKQAIAIIQSKL